MSFSNLWSQVSRHWLAYYHLLNNLVLEKWYKCGINVYKCFFYSLRGMMQDIIKQGYILHQDPRST